MREMRPACVAEKIARSMSPRSPSDSTGREVTQRGESTCYEGLQLLAIYAVLGLTFSFV